MYQYSFSLWPDQGLEKNYDACYEWRKVLLRSDLWSKLYHDLREYIARLCIVYKHKPEHLSYLPSGSTNHSRIDNTIFYFDFEEIKKKK